MIALRKIFKYYDNKFQRMIVLKDVTLSSVKEGEFVSILRHSGAKKSRRLNIIGMLYDTNEGEYLFIDQPAHQITEKKKTEFHRNYMEFIFQAFHLIDENFPQNNLTQSTRIDCNI